MKNIKTPVEFIVIACCTYKRPEKLKCLLSSLTKLNLPQDIPVKILIVDNDIEQSSKAAVEEFNNTLDIHYVVESNKGLANARNKALKTAIELNASHLAFIDDDETADKNWITAHVDFYSRFENIFISNGPAYPKFKENTPNYIIKNKIFAPYSCEQLGKIKRICPSNNVFLALNTVKNNEIYFSQEFNSSGGEDTDFFTRMSSAGFCIGWNYNAIVFEVQDENRTNIKWILERAYNIGRTTGYLKIKNKKNLIKKILYITDKFMKIILNIIISIFSILFGPTAFVNKLTDLAGYFGNIAGASNLKLSNYYGEK